MDKITEEELVARSTFPRVTLEELSANIAEQHYIQHGLLTLCILTLANGFTVVGESACAVPGNFKKDVGHRLAYSNAVNKVWPLMGYELKTQVDMASKLCEKLEAPAPGWSTYTGIEALWATEMTRGDYNTYRGWTLPENENGNDEGYIVNRSNGHVSWFPKAIFEVTYRHIDIHGEGAKLPE